MKLSEYLYIKRYDAACFKRMGAPRKELHDVKCEACGTNIPRYLGPVDGILCSSCLQNNRHSCTRQEPLAITRSAIRE